MRKTTVLFMAAVLVLYLIVIVNAQGTCKGKPRTPKCAGAPDGGNNRKRKCKKSANNDMWNYNPVTKNCTKINYLGCAGNDNRWCSKILCESCRPR
ncbi:kunitz-type serine protease inhibitor homolog beta-bungarotoxin B5-B chain [Drosophila ficusphila]|uniref:kunitz-type serine protease inhibitor homolog beta-bungarotoxin B5-B chain n=1 Tax=Drosophila ficusphila TaxID=30025 RepID=UPI0007E7E5AF|nr:kunitz-type serine protease inhibitor homolog beta-bungarotoxin B5-B chain [Drosophila ficusphila]